MPAKSFEHTIRFSEVPGRGWYPIVRIRFTRSNGRQITLPLLFDTGASDIFLRRQFEPFFPPGSVDSVNAPGADQPVDTLVTRATIEFLGKSVADCPIAFLDLGSSNPLFAGLFGRRCFEPFGFGFWQAAHELYITLNP